MQKLIQLKNKKGFTLIEMLIVILIIVILIAIAVPAISSYRADSQRTADIGAAKTLYTGIEAVIAQRGYIEDADGFVDPYTDATDTTRNLLTTTQVMDPTAGYSAALMGDILDAIGRHDFPGMFKFGYDVDTNSIIWVSYHNNDNTLSSGNGRTAHASNVMIYDIENDITGYADELGAPYDAIPYIHHY